MTTTLNNVFTMDHGTESLAELVGSTALTLLDPTKVFCFFPRYTSPDVSYGVHILDYVNHGFRQGLGREFFTLATPVGLFSEKTIARWIWEWRVMHGQYSQGSLGDIAEVNPKVREVIMTSSILPIEWKGGSCPDFLEDHLIIFGAREALTNEVTKWVQ